MVEHTEWTDEGFNIILQGPSDASKDAVEFYSKFVERMVAICSLGGGGRILLPTGWKLITRLSV